MINCSDPTDWYDLQRQVSQILRECGLESEIEKDIQTVRGTVNIDVHATDNTQSPPVTYLCECKYWRSAVPQTVIHAFRTVVGDYGANWGLVISRKGFQSGAIEAVKNSNVRLLDWRQFQDIFVDRWYAEYFMPQLNKAADPLIEYTEPKNRRIFRKADKLSELDRKRFVELRHKHSALAFAAIPYFMPLMNKGIFSLGLGELKRPVLPLRGILQQSLPEALVNLPDDLLDARCMREFLDVFNKRLEDAVAEFDQVFGGRA